MIFVIYILCNNQQIDLKIFIKKHNDIFSARMLYQLFSMAQQLRKVDIQYVSPSDDIPDQLLQHGRKKFMYL